MIRLVIEPPTKLLNANDRLHWARKAAATRLWRDAAAVTARAAKVEPLGRAHVMAWFRFPTNHRRDVANFYGTVKACLDGAVGDAGILPGDDDAHLIGPDMRREYPNGPIRLTLTFEEIQ